MKKNNRKIGTSKTKHLIVLSVVLMAFGFVVWQTEFKYVSMGVVTVAVTIW